MKSEGSSLRFDRPFGGAAADFPVLKFLVNERPGRGHFQFLLGLVFVARVLLQVQQAEPLSLLDVGLLLTLTQLLPLLAEPLGDLRIVDIGLDLNYLLPFIM